MALPGLKQQQRGSDSLTRILRGRRTEMRQNTSQHSERTLFDFNLLSEPTDLDLLTQH